MSNTKDKLRAIKPFVKLKIPINKKMFSSAEKGLITRYYNILDSQGYFNNDNIGYQLITISGKTAPKISGAPKITKRFVDIGTIVENGQLKTNPNRKARIKNGKIFVYDNSGNMRTWRFRYNIAKNWETKDFARYIKRQFGKDLKKKRYFAIGAGLKYEVRGSISTSLENLANDILKMGYGYTPNLKEQYEHNGQTKYLKDWLQEIVVYEELEDVEARIKNRKYKKKQRKPKVRDGKRNSRN